MSFFKKMVDKFEDLVGDDDKKKDEKKEEKKKEDKHEGMLTLGVSLSEVNTARTICRLTSSAAATKDQSFHDQQAPYGQQPQYNNQPSYGQQPQYGQSQAYGAPPPSHAPSTGGPPLPPGWIAQWDQNSQRYYYLDQATGRTQWELPQAPQGSYPPPGASKGSFPPAGAPMGAPGYDTRGAPGGYYSQETKQVVPNADGSGYKTTVEKKEKKDGKGGMLAAGAGGLAVGAVGGAMIGHAMGMHSFISSSIPLFFTSPFTSTHPPDAALTPLQATIPTTNTAATRSSPATASNPATLSSHSRATTKRPGLRPSKHPRLEITAPSPAATAKI